MQRSHLFTHIINLHTLVLRECLAKLFKAILDTLTDRHLIQIGTILHLRKEIGCLLIDHRNRLIGMRIDIVVKVMPEEFRVF